MTTRHRTIAISLVAILLLTGFAIGRISSTSNTNAAETTKVASEATTAQAQPQTAAGEDQFYLSDYKAGYNDGFNAVESGSSGVTANTSRAGYNEGFKQGYADAYQAQADESEASTKSSVVTPASTTRERVVYRESSRPVYVTKKSSGNSKLKTALRIAAPAAIGAGVGAMIKGKKGAGIGALLGGGGGAVYELMRRRNRN